MYMFKAFVFVDRNIYIYINKYKFKCTNKTIQIKIYCVKYFVCLASNIIDYV